PFGNRCKTLVVTGDSAFLPLPRLTAICSKKGSQYPIAVADYFSSPGKGGTSRTLAMMRSKCSQFTRLERMAMASRLGAGVLGPPRIWRLGSWRLLGVTDLPSQLITWHGRN